MQNYIDIALKNGIDLKEEGSCQFCGANTSRGVHECVELFSLGFEMINYSKEENHFYRFLSVDAHTLQHSEIHGRWNNHFHLLRQHLIFKYQIPWTYQLSPKLSNYLNKYKGGKQDEFLHPPEILKRGEITTTDILANSSNESGCQQMIEKWGIGVYNSWEKYHELIDGIALGFLGKR